MGAARAGPEETAALTAHVGQELRLTPSAAPHAARRRADETQSQWRKRNHKGQSRSQ